MTFEEWKERWSFEKRRPAFDLEDKLIGQAALASKVIAMRCLEEAFERGLAAALYRDEPRSCYWVIVWNEDALKGMLERRATIVAAAGWPLTPSQFILRLLSEATPTGALHDLICDAFDEKTNRNRAEFQTDKWKARINEFLDTAIAPRPVSLWPREPEPEEEQSSAAS